MSLFPPDLYSEFPSFSAIVRVASPSVALRAPPPPVLRTGGGNTVVASTGGAGEVYALR